MTMALMALPQGPHAMQHRGTASGLVVRCSGTAMPKNLTTSSAAMPVRQLAGSPTICYVSIICQVSRCACW